VLGADDDGEWSANARREHQHREGALTPGGWSRRDRRGREGGRRGGGGGGLKDTDSGSHGWQLVYEREYRVENIHLISI
jgi:hypothetical protein